MLFFSSLLLLAGCHHQPPPAGAAPQQAQTAPVTDDPHAVLIQATADLDVSVRLRALSVLIEHAPAPGGGEWGTRALYDPSPYVQRAGVDALGARIHEPESRALLRALVGRDGDPFVRGHAGVLLAQAQDTQALAALQEALRLEPEHWRRVPLALAAAMMGDGAALELLLTDLARGDLALELTLFRDLGASGLSTLAPALLQGLDLMEPELEVPVAAALMQLGEKKGQSMLHQALGSDDVVLRLEAVDALTMVYSPRATTLLEKARFGPASDYANMALVERAQAPLGDALRAMESSDRELRQQAVWAMGGYLSRTQRARGHRKAHAALLLALQDQEPVVVSEAVQALGRAGYSQDRASLAPFLSAETTTLQVLAAQSMLSLAAPTPQADHEPQPAAEAAGLTNRGAADR